MTGSSRFAYSAEQKIALVIGNSAYPSSRLRNPVNDATAMAAKLRALGFDVILRTDVNLRDMTRSFSQFGQKLTPGSVSLFYYAGHGVQVHGKNFLIPVDAEIESEASVRTEAVDVDQLLHQLGPARLSMVILDACRNNPFERRFRALSSSGLAQIDAPTGTLLAYATAPGKVAADGSGSNGTYTEALLKALDMPGLKVEDVFKQVRIDVLKASDNQQTPWESSSLTGEFYFRPGSKGEIENAQLQRSEKERAEIARTLEEERKKRDKDAELVRAEMEKLRAELQMIRAEAAKQATPTVVVAATTAPATIPAPGIPTAVAIQKPQQVAIASSPPSTTATIPSATAIVHPEQSPGLSAPASPASSSAWTERISLLEKLRGQLTYAKAMAILLDINGPEDLSILLTHEGKMKTLNWHGAYAIGADKNGNLTWGGGYKLRTVADATETAIEFCAKGPDVMCKVVILDGAFQENNFIDIAQRLGGQNIMAVRQAYVKSLVRNPLESRVGQLPGTTGGDAASIGFANLRE